MGNPCIPVTTTLVWVKLHLGMLIAPGPTLKPRIPHVKFDRICEEKLREKRAGYSLICREMPLVSYYLLISVNEKRNGCRRV